jgi:hypothetical protein
VLDGKAEGATNGEGLASSGAGSASSILGSWATDCVADLIRACLLLYIA